MVSYNHRKEKTSKNKRKNKDTKQKSNEIHRQDVTADANKRGGATDLPKPINDNIRTDG
ncbi:MAG: hypothetical protein IIZ46_03805 [Clostridia bacterium]|nr:hypothetical protein [Clostridia bacterium]